MRSHRLYDHHIALCRLKNMVVILQGDAEVDIFKEPAGLAVKEGPHTSMTQTYRKKLRVVYIKSTSE